MELMMMTGGKKTIVFVANADSPSAAQQVIGKIRGREQS
jgi:hypothetical protein